MQNWANHELSILIKFSSSEKSYIKILHFLFDHLFQTPWENNTPQDFIWQEEQKQLNDFEIYGPSYIIINESNRSRMTQAWNCMLKHLKQVVTLGKSRNLERQGASNLKWMPKTQVWGHAPLKHLNLKVS